MEHLEFCPFCNSPIGRPIMDACVDGYFATCENIKNCGIDGPVRDTEKKAAEAWNTRATPEEDKIIKLLQEQVDSAVEDIEQLEEKLKKIHSQEKE